MEISTKQVLQVLYIISWIIFVGVCIDACGFISNALYALADPDIVNNFWQGNNLSGLYKHDPGYFFVLTFLMSIVGIVKALLFYLIIKLLHDKKLDMSQPFSKDVGRFIFNMSYLALFTGFFAGWGAGYTEWFISQGVTMPTIEKLGLGGADVWLFMGGVLFVIAQIFKKGVEMQAENEFTI